VQAVLLDDDVETKEADKDEKEKQEEENFSRKEVGFDDMMRYGFAQREAFGSIKCTTMSLVTQLLVRLNSVSVKLRRQRSQSKDAHWNQRRPIASA
jgi:hypothetical protein